MKESKKETRRIRAIKKIDSALPDEIIYHIFSFFDMRDVVNTWLLSNKWRYLWMSTPTLNFDNVTYNFGISDRFCEPCYLNRDGFESFVNNVLTLTSSDLVKFQLVDSYYVTQRRLYTWVNVSLARKVQDVDIRIEVTEMLSLPPELFSSKVKVLRLRCKAKMPNSMCAAEWIKNLDLESITLPDGNTNGELDLSFPVLESLRIAKSNASHLKIISIFTPVLESLEFNRFHTHKDKSCKVKTCTPNLKSLMVNDDMYGFRSMLNYCMEDLSSLVSADMHFPLFSGGISVEECIKRLSEAVSWMYNVQDLKLSVSSVRLLVDQPELLRRLPGLFPNLKHVKLYLDGHKNFHMKAVLKFLGRAPHLETLILEGYDPDLYTPDEFEEECTKEEEWAGEEWIQSVALFNHMISFEIRNFEGLNVEMKFLKFVLEKAIVLKKMVIKTNMEWLQGKRKEDILSFSRASSSVSISFQIQEFE